MPVYMLFIRETPVRDAAEMETYLRLSTKAAAGHKLIPRIVNGTMQAVEGDAPDGVVLLEFDSEEEAWGWYQSPDYQEALQHRLKGADYRAVLIHGVE